MALTICNPINLSYRFQAEGIADECCREAADPSAVQFKDKFWLFTSKSSGYWYSKDLKEWTFIESKKLPVEDYAPDVRVMNGWLYCTASRNDSPCPIFRSQDPENDDWEEVSAPFIFWDPNMYQDDDGRIYLYWGCHNETPLYGVEMDAETMMPIGEPTSLFGQNHDKYGWERTEENHTGSAAPYIEGAWMTKHKGVYYLQYAAPGTEWNTYGDGVYTASSPLGPYTYAEHNPFSYKPGGFITGAGHGSTVYDNYDNLWHFSTMQISCKHPFERRVGLFPAGFDNDGVLFCNTRFADYPMKHTDRKWNPLEDSFSGWMLLSYNKKATCSSALPGHQADLAVDESVRTYWASADETPWLQIDLNKASTVNSIQVNFAEHDCAQHKRPETPLKHQYILEGSVDGETWFNICDKRNNTEDVPHDYIELKTAVTMRFVRLTITHMPANGKAAISGLRIFGKGDGDIPETVSGVKGCRVKDDPMSADIAWVAPETAIGYNVLWGISKDKLYSCWQIYDKTELQLRSLTAGQDYWVAIEAFNENGVASLSEIIKI